MENKTSNKLIYPAAIVVAAIIIAGAIIYKNSPSSESTNTQDSSSATNKTTDQESSGLLDKTQFSYTNLAQSLGLDKEEFTSCINNPEIVKEIDKDYQDAQDAGVNSTPTTFINGISLIGARGFADYEATIERALNGEEILDGPEIDDDAVLGDINAPVTMIIFGDYECPFCKKAFDTAESQVIEEYVKTGQVKMVYRDYPLFNIHPAAIPAAIAAECAGEQGAYWQYHDALFENQESLTPELN